MTTSSSARLRMKRAASADRLNSRKLDLLSDDTVPIFKCKLDGFPYCCTKHYYEYRRWPYYLEPPPSGAYPAYRSSRYWLDWPRYPYGHPNSSYYYNYYYGGYRRYRPWYNSYYSYDDYYGDYLRGYAEGMRKYGDGDEAKRRRRRASSAADDLLADGIGGSCYRPYYHASRRYL